MNTTLETPTTRRKRPEVRSTCNLQPATCNPVRVQFAHWQPFPAIVPMPDCGHRLANGQWKMQMFQLLDDLGDRQEGSTVSLATLLASGVPFQRVEVVSDPAEAASYAPKTFNDKFWLAMKAAADMAADGETQLTITALEEALRLAKLEQREANAGADGVICPG